MQPVPSVEKIHAVLAGYGREVSRMPVFDGSEKIIGRGAQAVVYHWQGFAYKVYPDQYPKEWIRHELQVQDVVSKLNLPVVK